MKGMFAGIFVAAGAAFALWAGSSPLQQGGIVMPFSPPPPATDAEALLGRVNGVLASISGSELQIEIRDPYVPRVGDRVDLYESGSGGAPLAGDATITYAEGDIVRAKATQVYRPLACGMKTVVYSGLSCCMKVPFNLALGLPEDPRVAASQDRTNGWLRLREVEARGRKLFEQAQSALAEHNYAAAASPLRQAAELDHEDAQYELFRMYVSKAQEAPGAAEAANLLRRSAELGKVEAQRDLGFALQGRFDVLGADAGKAQAWLRKAAAGGSREAKEALRN